MCESDGEVRYLLYALARTVEANPGVRLAAWEEEFIDSVVVGELPLSRRQRRIAGEILGRWGSVLQARPVGV